MARERENRRVGEATKAEGRSPRTGGRFPATTALLAAAFLALGCLAGALPAAAQSVLDAPVPEGKPAAPAAPAPSAGGAAAEAKAGEAGKGSVPTAFRGIELGMGRDEVIAALKKDSIYNFRGPEDVTLLPSPNQSLIDVSGLSFVKRAFFQFYEGKLWVIIVELNPDKIDHYSIFTSLSAKYGDPALLDPKEARWEDKATRLALERPLTLRYMDMAAYGKLKDASAAKESVEELDRKDFLSGL